MNPVYEKLCACYESIRARIPFTPEIALVLGSGLGNYASKLSDDQRQNTDRRFLCCQHIMI